MDNNCQECSELWNAYREATSAHLTATQELVRSMLDDNQDAWKALTQKEATAFCKTLKLRRTIRQHQIDTHNSIPTGFAAAVGGF
jgi:hypothetical protein